MAVAVLRPDRIFVDRDITFGDTREQRKRPKETGDRRESSPEYAV